MLLHTMSFCLVITSWVSSVGSPSPSSPSSTGRVTLKYPLGASGSEHGLGVVPAADEERIRKGLLLFSLLLYGARAVAAAAVWSSCCCCCCCCTTCRCCCIVQLVLPTLCSSYHIIRLGSACQKVPLTLRLTLLRSSLSDYAAAHFYFLISLNAPAPHFLTTLTTLPLITC